MRNGLEKLEQKDYKEKLDASARPQLIFFTAEWSEPCRQMQGVIEQLALECYDAADFYLADLDDQPLIAADFKIVNVPALSVCREGRELERVVGVRAYPDLKKDLAKYI